MSYYECPRLPDYECPRCGKFCPYCEQEEAEALQWQQYKRDVERDARTQALDDLRYQLTP